MAVSTAICTDRFSGPGLRTRISTWRRSVLPSSPGHSALLTRGASGGKGGAMRRLQPRRHPPPKRCHPAARTLLPVASPLRSALAPGREQISLADAQRSEIFVHGDAGDKSVVVRGLGKQLGGSADVAGKVAAGVDHRVPAPALEGVQAASFGLVAAQLLDLRKQVGVVPAPVEQRDGVPAAPVTLASTRCRPKNTVPPRINSRMETAAPFSAPSGSSARVRRVPARDIASSRGGEVPRGRQRSHRPPPPGGFMFALNFYNDLSMGRRAQEGPQIRHDPAWRQGRQVPDWPARCG